MQRKMKTNELGRRGEDAAAKYLEKSGYAVISRNERIGRIETDIICEGDGHTVFCEVKTRTPASKKYGRPSAAVDRKKRENLIRFAEAYIRSKKAAGAFLAPPRIDVVEVYIDGKDVKIHHMKNAVIKETND